ncbi:MAG TPA: cation:proton antiporter [Candidatus Paceibacterota bacterium]|nr:cation:proton antiporter [Candidatus Paceibacterota bacterium]HPT18356.1 cation:proton antiporter [Candidatus Paceibacterota bacterium]
MEIFIEIGLIIFIATIVSFIMKMFKQPLIVGYIISGIIVGPYLLNLTQSTEYVELFSKFGIAILLFIIGLNLKPDVIREVGKASFLTGIGQIVITSVLGFFLMKTLGFDSTSSLYGALALSFSSTIIALKFLYDKGDLDKLYGKISVGCLLVQDIVATIVILVISIAGSANLADGNALTTIVSLLAKGVLFFFALYFLSKYILPKVSSFLASSQELLFLFSITWGLGLAAVFYVFGFSLEIGALAAGVALSSSAFSREISSRMKPLRDFFILLFFVSLGSQLILSDIHGIIFPAILISIFVLLIKPIVVIFLMNLLGYKNRTGFSTGLVISQVSEFSLILLSLGMSLGHLSGKVVSLITLVAIFTISGSTYFILHSEKIYQYVKKLIHIFTLRKHSNYEIDKNSEDAEIVIFGYDRVGYDFVNIAQKTHSRYFVIDFDPKSINKLEKNNIPHYFGDAEDVDFLEDVKIIKAKAIISTIPDFKTNLNLVSYYRNHNKDGIVIVISHNIKDAKELYRHGASFVVMPHYLGAKHAAKMIENYGLKAEEFEKEKKQHLEDLENRLRITGEK